jgi:protein-S-isoprenylcysteine O-methyltransferase Ste14
MGGSVCYHNNVKKTDAPDRRVAWAYVSVQVVLLVAIVFWPSGNSRTVTQFELLGNILEWLGWAGIALSAISIRSSLTAVPLPKEHAQLATNGLYRIIRHPMYASVMVLCLGIALSSGMVIKYLIFVALAALFHFKSRYEERYLRQKFPEYEAYAQRTGRIIPFIK